MVALSFGIDQMLYGLSPAGYATTNLALYSRLFRTSCWALARLPPVAAVFGTGGGSSISRQHGTPLDQRTTSLLATVSRCSGPWRSFAAANCGLDG